MNERQFHKKKHFLTLWISEINLFLVLSHISNFYYMIKSLFIKIYISEISISIKGVKIKFGIIILKNLQSIQRYIFQQNRCYGIWSLERPPASVIVNRLFLQETLFSSWSFCKSDCIIEIISTRPSSKPLIK